MLSDLGLLVKNLGEEKLADVVRETNWRVLGAFHETLVRRLREYLFVGGMPSAVSAYSANSSFSAAREEQLEVLSDYNHDFAKHAPKVQVPRIRAIWRSLPAQLAKEDKRFVMTDVEVNGKQARSRDLKDPFEWLEAAGLAYRVWDVSKPCIPLDSYRKSVFKLFGLDVGLLGAQSKLSAKAVVEGSRVFTEFKGALTEQFVQQEIRAEAGLAPFYWSAPDSRAEVDFLVETDDGVIPVEVKAERNLQAKSLKRYAELFCPEFSIRTSMSEWSRREKLLDIPLYAIGQADRRR